MSSALGLALVALVPLVVLTLTCFVKISVVLSLARNAIGSQEAPSGLVVTGLSLVLTCFVMAPVGIDMLNAATSDAPPPVSASAFDTAVRKAVPPEYAKDVDAAERAAEPLRAWLSRHAATADKATFTDLAGKLGHAATPDDLRVVAPAFVTSELKQAFAIAVLVFLPFLVMDLVVALGLSSLGLTSTNPQTVALPLKLLLFVAVDGWRLLIDGLLRGYA